MSRQRKGLAMSKKTGMDGSMVGMTIVGQRQRISVGSAEGTEHKFQEVFATRLSQRGVLRCTCWSLSAGEDWELEASPLVMRGARSSAYLSQYPSAAQMGSPERDRGSVGRCVAPMAHRTPLSAKRGLQEPSAVAVAMSQPILRVLPSGAACCGRSSLPVGVVGTHGYLVVPLREARCAVFLRLARVRDVPCA